MIDFSNLPFLYAGSKWYKTHAGPVQGSVQVGSMPNGICSRRHFLRSAGMPIHAESLALRHHIGITWYYILHPTNLSSTWLMTPKHVRNTITSRTSTNKCLYDRTSITFMDCLVSKLFVPVTPVYKHKYSGCAIPTPLKYFKQGQMFR